MQPEKEKYQRLDQRPYESHYLYVDTVIDHPVESVWPHALNIGSWMNAHRLATIAGKAGEVGHFERVFPKGVGPEVGLPHYHLYGVTAVVPLKYIALEVLPEKGGSYGDEKEWMSFDGILLTDMGSRTHVALLMIDVQMGRRSEEERQRRKQEIAEGRTLVHQYFENLQQLVGRAG